MAMVRSVLQPGVIRQIGRFPGTSFFMKSLFLDSFRAEDRAYLGSAFASLDINFSPDVPSSPFRAEDRAYLGSAFASLDINFSPDVLSSPFRAEDRARTGYPQLGRLMLYQMSYFRFFATRSDLSGKNRSLVGRTGFEPVKA